MAVPSSRAQPLPERIASLDAVRGIAAVIVVIYHILLVLPAFDAQSESWIVELIKSWPLRLLWGGDEAVIVFFVLSGFVLAPSFLGLAAPTWGVFALRRLLRLYPAYVVSLLVAAGCSAALSTHHIDGLSDFFNNGWSRPIEAAAVLRGALFLDDSSNINVVVWTLVIEMRVSLIFPILIAATMRLGPVAALVFFSAVSVTTIMVAPLVSTGGWLGAAMLTLLKTSYFLIFFVVGILLAAHRSVLIARLSGAWRDTRIAVFVLGIGLLGSNGKLPYEVGWLAVGLGFALVLSVILSTPEIENWLHWPVLQWLGKISYSLYLSHIVVLYSLFYTLHHTFPPPVIMALVLPASLGVAWALWFFVERPSITWSRRIATARSAR